MNLQPLSVCGENALSQKLGEAIQWLFHKKRTINMFKAVLSALSVVKNETYRFRLHARQIIANTSFSHERKNLQNSKLKVELLTEIKKEKPQRLKQETKKTKHSNCKLENRLN